MMTKKKLSEIEAQVAALVDRLPKGWLAKEIKAAQHDPSRDVQTLEMICAALERQTKRGRNRAKPAQTKVTGGTRPTTRRSN